MIRPTIVIQFDSSIDKKINSLESQLRMAEKAKEDSSAMVDIFYHDGVIAGLNIGLELLKELKGEYRL